MEAASHQSACLHKLCGVRLSSSSRQAHHPCGHCDCPHLQVWGCRAKEVRLAKKAGHTEKRRRMMDELQRREQTVAAQRSQEELARARLKVRRALHLDISTGS